VPTCMSMIRETVRSKANTCTEGGGECTVSSQRAYETARSVGGERLHKVLQG
jgi:hypothetical protein